MMARNSISAMLMTGDHILVDHEFNLTGIIDWE
jgi:hypothetical protein